MKLVRNLDLAKPLLATRRLATCQRGSSSRLTRSLAATLTDDGLALKLAADLPIEVFSTVISRHAHRSFKCYGKVNPHLSKMTANYGSIKILFQWLLQAFIFQQIEVSTSPDFTRFTPWNPLTKQVQPAENQVTERTWRRCVSRSRKFLPISVAAINQTACGFLSGRQKDG